MHKHARRLWNFPGGLQLAPHKSKSTQTLIKVLPAPATVTLPVKQHIGESAEILVQPRDTVHKGQVIAQAHDEISAPVHATTSGTIEEIALMPIPHPSGLSDQCIIIRADGRDEWSPNRPKPIEDYPSINPVKLLMRVRECGIVGLGGAAFPTAVKLNLRPGHSIDTLIINGVECEPYISCDEMLMRERAAEILNGVGIIRHILGAPDCLIAIEDNMPLAIEAMRHALKHQASESIKLVSIPTVYPSGGERQLIKVLTGREVPSGGLPHDIGMVCHNVGTAYAVHRAVVHGEPLISRIVTVTGEGVNQPGNLEVRLGTSIVEVIEASGGYTTNVERLIMGGPMMGFAMQSDDVPVVKATNCLLVTGPDEVTERGQAMPCIRCGECTRVCPAHLLPQELYWHAKAKNFDQTLEYNLFDCIECGCCSYVCPSNIPLVQYYRYAKTEIAAREREHQAADAARLRHEFRAQRLEKAQRERAERLAKKKAALTKKDKDITILAALERSKAKKTKTTPPVSLQTKDDDERAAH